MNIKNGWKKAYSYFQEVGGQSLGLEQLEKMSAQFCHAKQKTQKASQLTQCTSKQFDFMAINKSNQTQTVSIPQGKYLDILSRQNYEGNTIKLTAQSIVLLQKLP